MWRYIALGVGAGSVMMVVTTASIVGRAMFAPRQKPGNQGLAAALSGGTSAGRASATKKSNVFSGLVKMKQQQKVAAEEAGPPPPPEEAKGGLVGEENA